MLRPVFDQQTRRDGAMNTELRHALCWWITVLGMELAELRGWEAQDDPIVHLFCDARGAPAHLGAVVFADDVCLYTHLAPPGRVLDRFRPRRVAFARTRQRACLLLCLTHAPSGKTIK